MEDQRAKVSGVGDRHSSLVERPSFTQPKKLIVCCDGTWMDADNGWVPGTWGRKGHLQTPSNVTRLARAISDEDDAHHPQVVYYQAGIGTGLGLFSHLAGGGTGMGLSENIREAYAFLASNYREHDHERPGVSPDSIFLVGFSRGAFTARSISGFIGAIGILKKEAMAHFYEIFEDYENAGSPGYTPLFFARYFDRNPDVQARPIPLALAHDRSNIRAYLDEYLKLLLSLDLTQEVRINGIGVWDTVGALGIPINPILQRLFPFLPSFIKNYSWYDTSLDSHIDFAAQALALDEHRYPFAPTLWETRPGGRTLLRQTWFPGAHSNVGGSYADPSIADISLAWMMDQLSGNTAPPSDPTSPRDWIKFDAAPPPAHPASPSAPPKPPHYRGWAMGQLYDSATFPASLTGTRVRVPGRYRRTDFATGTPSRRAMLSGTQERVHASVRERVQRRGRGVEVDEAKVFPRGLNVRPFLRRLFGGGARCYEPQAIGGPLEGWRVERVERVADEEEEDGEGEDRRSNNEEGEDRRSNNESHGDHDMKSGRAPRWVYTGGKQHCDSGVMLEDTLGPFEQRLLARERAAAGEDGDAEGGVVGVFGDKLNGGSLNGNGHGVKRGVAHTF